MSETTHANADIITAVSDAHKASAGALKARIHAVRMAVASGVTVKTLTADLKAANALDSSVVSVSAGILGYALCASEMIELSGMPLSKVSAPDAADIYRAAKRVGAKAFRLAVRESLKTLADDVTTVDRFGVLLSTAAVALDTTLTVKAPAERAARTGGTSDADAPADGDTATAPAKAVPAASPVDGIRAAVKFLQQGGALSADMESAIAELTSAASAARKRARVAA